MRSHIISLTIIAGLYTGVFLTCTSAYAQSYEDQAKAILRLFESGQKDSAYALLEPLKRNARFVPAVLFTRAQMTPDDRALSLYKEVIALEPNGAWGDQAAFQLVVRYAEKRDSLAAYVWSGVLNALYPRSPQVLAAADLLKSIASWRAADEEFADASSSIPRPVIKDEPPLKKAEEKTVPKKVETKKAGEKISEPKAVEATSKTLAEVDTYKASGMKGYALQVGVFSTRDLADNRSSELKKKSIRAVALTKMVEGKKYYALVVGPYPSIEEASKKRSTVAGICACEAFVVKVQ